MLLFADGEDHGIQLIFDPAVAYLRDEARRIFRAGQLFAEGVQAEAVVDALVQNAAELRVAF